MAYVQGHRIGNRIYPYELITELLTLNGIQGEDFEIDDDGDLYIIVEE
jgi:hypothetical protein